MLVVSDTTPLISFLKIGHIDLLEKLFGKVFIPQAVYNELTALDHLGGLIFLQKNCKNY